MFKVTKSLIIVKKKLLCRLSESGLSDFFLSLFLTIYDIKRKIKLLSYPPPEGNFRTTQNGLDCVWQRKYKKSTFDT